MDLTVEIVRCEINSDSIEEVILELKYVSGIIITFIFFQLPLFFMAKILVTGCAGFIGQRTCLQLLEAGHQVVGLDTVNNFYDHRLKTWRLELLEQYANMDFKNRDITDSYVIKRFLKYSHAERKFDAVIHLAAMAGVRNSLTDPWIYESVNARGTLNILEACRENDIKKLVMASTSSLYGSHMGASKESDPVHPQSPYAATKLGAEALCQAYHYLYGIDITIPRYFTVYGEAGRPDMSIFRFIEFIRRGLPIQINGDGKQIRDFTYVGDIAKGTIKCLKPVGFEIINLGNNNPVELNYVLELIEKELGKQGERVHSPFPKADVPYSCAYIQKAKELLDWEPEVSIEEGIRRTVKWHLTHKTSYDLPQ